MMKDQHKFQCEKCGAGLQFSTEDNDLKCSYCSHVNIIKRTFKNFEKRDYEATILEVDNENIHSEINTTNCTSCGATFNLNKNLHASSCPYCATPIVNATSAYRAVTPQAILPFEINQKEAQKFLKKWLKGLWFAPNKLKEYTKNETKLKGIYIPYWTYDAKTNSIYQGRRGEHYYVTEYYDVTKDGKQHTQTRQVEKTRWYDVSGSFQESFDDVIVIATNSLSHSLKNWDIENLVDYNSSYISGYESELYSISLDEGLANAKDEMEKNIRESIKLNIGGDIQEIEQLNTNYSNIKYKHILLPIYASAFKFNKKTYSYVINGRNGDVLGERPYSILKIAFTIASILTVGATIYFFSR